MSVNLPQLTDGSDPSLPVPVDPSRAMQFAPDHGGYQRPEPSVAEEGSILTMSRILAALRRYRWLVASLVVLGLVGGFVARRFVEPTYVVNATVFASPTKETTGGALASDGALTRNQGWRDLLMSFAIIDPVVRELALYLRPEKAADSVLFANFAIDTTKKQWFPGDYTLETQSGRYTLTDKLGFIREQGVIGDSVGRSAGFAWVPPARRLGTQSRTVGFKVMTPREASVDIRNRLAVRIQLTSPVIAIDLTGTAAQRPAATVNAMITRFVEVAGDLKKRELVQSATTLNAQLNSAQGKLQGAERQLENYRIGIIAKPSEGSVMIPSMPTSGSPSEGGALAVARDPIFGQFAGTKYEYESIKADRVQLESLAKALRASDAATVSVDRLLSVPIVVREPGAASLRSTVAQIDQAEANLRQALLTLTDSEPQIKAARRGIRELREATLPKELDEFMGTVRARESMLQMQLADARKELEQIPQRTIQQGALQREQLVAADQYTQLRAAYAQANLAQLSAVPDVKLLDSAVTPLEPSSNTTPVLIGGGLLLGLGLGLALAIILDLLDNRFRYPDQVSKELGLEVLGVVPVIDQSGRRQTPERIAQIVEAFRSIRMNVRYASNSTRGIALGITSPGPGDGKSLIASNLALSFAEGGWRTVLVDADTRRGGLHTTFDLAAGPGLVEYLEGTSLLSEVLYATRHDNLSFVPTGTRHRRAPELLATPRLQQFLATLAADYDVVIIDTPPLGAGTDAYAVGTACGQLALVLRSNKTDLKMAKAKLNVLDQLPVTVLGAILNEVRTDTSAYQYYAYDTEYLLTEEPAALTSGGSRGAVATRDA
jgi:capsular exopolysaccharide synthesis family protein